MARNPSSTGAIAKRLGVSAHYGSTYRGRLIAAGIIAPTRQGYVDFAIPYLREYLREHAAQYEMATRHSRRSAREQSGRT